MLCGAVVDGVGDDDPKNEVVEDNFAVFGRLGGFDLLRSFDLDDDGFGLEGGENDNFLFDLDLLSLSFGMDGAPSSVDGVVRISGVIVFDRRFWGGLRILARPRRDFVFFGFGDSTDALSDGFILIFTLNVTPFPFFAVC